MITSLIFVVIGSVAFLKFCAECSSTCADSAAFSSDSLELATMVDEDMPALLDPLISTNKTLPRGNVSGGGSGAMSLWNLLPTPRKIFVMIRGTMPGVEVAGTIELILKLIAGLLCGVHAALTLTVASLLGVDEGATVVEAVLAATSGDRAGVVLATSTDPPCGGFETPGAEV